MSIVYNNLCPNCHAEQSQGVDISHKTARVRIYPEQEDSPTILICIHPEGSSILDLGECSGCRKTGVIAAPEDQRGTHNHRDLNFVTLEIDTTSEEAACYCPDCNAVTLCDHCGKSVRSFKEYIIEGVSKKLCRGCSSEVSMCSVCGKVHTFYDGALDLYICSSCKQTQVFCPTCKSRLPSKEDYLLFGDSFGCKHCLSVQTCAYCDTKAPTRYVIDTGYICGEHYPLVNKLPYVGGYHHTKVIDFKKRSYEKNTNVFFGIENEVQLLLSDEAPPRNLEIRRRLLTKEVLNLFPDCDCKHDGSLAYHFRNREYNAGVELVWQPMSWGFFKDSKVAFKEMFKIITPMLRKNMAQAGMHIHISKEAFSPLHFLKFTNFFYMQEKAKFLRVIAGRGSNSYARINDGHSLDGHRRGVEYKGRALVYHEIAKKKKDPTKLKYRHSYRSYSDRYDCVNITNEKTYEIRIFKGARTYDEFIRRFTFVHSIYEYTRTVSRKDMGLADYFTFIKNNVKEYPELTKLVTKYEEKHK